MTSLREGIDLNFKRSLQGRRAARLRSFMPSERRIFLSFSTLVNRCYIKDIKKYNLLG